jgi:transcriptional regulator of heat shock response
MVALGLAGLLVIGSTEISYAQTIETVDVVENKIVTLIGEGFDPDVESLTFLGSN